MSKTRINTGKHSRESTHFVSAPVVVHNMDEAWHYSGSAAMLPTYVSGGQRYTSICIESETLTPSVPPWLRRELLIADKLAL